MPNFSPPGWVLPGIMLGLFAGAVSAADPYKDALQAYESGHLVTARQILRSADGTLPAKGAELLDQIEAARANVAQGGEVDRDYLPDNERVAELLLARHAENRLRSARGQSTADNTPVIQPGAVDAKKPITVQLQAVRSAYDEYQARIESREPESSRRGAADAHRPPVATHDINAPAAQQVVSARAAYDEYQAKIKQTSSMVAQGKACLDNETVRRLVEKERHEAAKAAMVKAEAIAKAQQIRQDRAVARLRGQITAEVTRKLRKEMDARFKQEVARRVAAIRAGAGERGLADAVSGGPSASFLAPPGEELTASALAGDHQAQQQLGHYHARSFLETGDPADRDQAQSWLTLAAEAGNAQAAYELGLLAFMALPGQPADYNEARYWWRLAAEQGNPNARLALQVLRTRARPIAEAGAES